MARKKKRRSGKNLQATMFKLIRLGALLAPAAVAATGPGNAEDKLEKGLSWYTGYSIQKQDFRMERLARGWMPFLMASLTTYGIPKLTGIIRRL